MKTRNINITILFNKKKKDIIFINLLLLYTVIYLYPMLNSGYYVDDSINSLIKATVNFDGQSILYIVYANFLYWFSSLGRFFPIAFYQYLIFYYINSLLLYKIIILVFICINILLFGYFVKLFTDSKRLSYLFMLTIPMFFQFRIYHDPILSYNFFMQFIFAFLLISFILFIKGLENKKNSFLLLSILSYIINLLSYEVTYMFFIFHFIIAYKIIKDFKSALLKTLPFLAVSFLAIIFQFIIRSQITISENSAYVINLDVVKYCFTVARQIIAAFPLSYYFFDPQKIAVHNLAGILSGVTIIDISISILFLYLVFSILKWSPLEKINVKYLFLLGISFIIIPSLLIGLSPKYQAEIILGIGYLPVYFQYFGMLIFLASILIYINRKIKSKKADYILKVLISIFIVLISNINIQTNRLVIENFNSIMYYPRLILENSMHNNLFKNVPANSTILLEKSSSWYRWDNKYFFYLNSNKRLNIIDKSQYLSDLAEKSGNSISKYGDLKYIDLSKDKIYTLKYESNEKNIGYVFLGKVHDIFYDDLDQSTPQINLEDLKIYSSNKNFYNSIIGKQCLRYNTPDTGIYSYFIKDLPLQSSSNTEKDSIYEFSSEEYFIEFNSLCLAKGDINLVGNNNDTKVLSINKIGRPQELISNDKNTILHNRFFQGRLTYDFVTDKVISISPFSSSMGLKGDALSFDGVSNSMVSLNKICVEKEFSIELVVYPYKNKVKYSNIIGNHPGLNNFEGFVLQQDGSQNYNNYIFGLGEGSRWVDFVPSLSFSIEPYKWHYIAINVYSDHVEIFDNGSLVKMSKYNESGMKNSELPLMVGNWSGNDRSFNGLVEEILISQKPKNSKNILDNWLKISQYIEKWGE